MGNLAIVPSSRVRVTLPSASFEAVTLCCLRASIAAWACRCLSAPLDRPGGAMAENGGPLCGGPHQTRVVGLAGGDGLLWLGW